MVKKRSTHPSGGAQAEGGCAILRPLLSPQPLDPLAVGVPALVSRDRIRLAIAPALVLAAEAVQAGSEGVVAFERTTGRRWGRAMLADHCFPSRPPQSVDLELLV